MFYDKEEVDELLKCPKCHERFVEPCVMPCGHSICRGCVSYSPEERTRRVKCPVCADVHVLPDNNNNCGGGGFLVNKLLLTLLEKKPCEVYRNETVESFKSMLGEIKLMTTNLVEMMNRSEEKIREHCEYVRNDVQIATESMIAYVNKLHAQFMLEIDEYEKSCLLNLAKLVSETGERARRTKLETDRFVDDWIKYLHRFRIDNSEVSEALDKAKSIKAELEMQESNFKFQIFNKKLMRFDENKQTLLDASLLGKLSLDSIVAPFSIQFNEMSEFNMEKSFSLIARFSFFRVYPLRNFKFVAFYRYPDGDICLSDFTKYNWFLQREAYIVFTENGKPIGVDECMSCQHDEEILFYIRVSSSKALVKLYKADASCSAKKWMGNEFTCFAMNETHVYGAETDYVNMFDKSMELVKRVAFAERVVRMEATNETLFLMDAERTVFVMSLFDHAVSKTFKLELDTFVLYLDKYLICFDEANKRLIWHDANGNKVEECLMNCPPDAAISLIGKSNDSLIFADYSKRKLYYH